MKKEDKEILKNALIEIHDIADQLNEDLEGTVYADEILAFIETITDKEGLGLV